MQTANQGRECTMKKLWLGVVVLALVPLAGCIHAPPGRSAPLHVEGSGSAVANDIFGLSGTFSGSAEGDFLGTGTIEGSWVVTGFNIGGCPSTTGTIAMTVTLTAENGGTITETWEATVCAVSALSQLGTGTSTITGGTGQFAKATGSGTVTFAMTTTAPRIFDFIMDGTLCCFG